MAASLWMLSIFATSSSVVTVGQLAHVVSSAAAGQVTEGGFRQVWEHVWWIFVKGWHATEFGILYLLVWRAAPSKQTLSLALPALFAISDEFHQLFVPSRGCGVSDVCIDWLGIAAAWSFASGWLGGHKRRPALLLALVGTCIGLLFLLSVYPFGLITLSAGAPAGSRP